MTEQEYFDEVARVAAAAPGHPLLRTLQSGHSKINEIYLQQAQKSVAAAVITEQEPEDEDVFDENDDPADPELARMRAEIRGLFFERNRLSNRFRDCGSKSERADVSADIETVQRNIARMMRRIRHWKIAGKLADDDQGGHYVPKDGLELAALRASLRASISRKKAEIKELRELDLTSDERSARKLEKCLTKLESLEVHLAMVLKAIAGL
jgi:hypothetical protein